MIAFTKAHAYGNDFLYVEKAAVEGRELDRLARELCDRHVGVGADGLIVFERTADGASMRLLNADGSRAEVSGNGVRALGAILLRNDARPQVEVAIHTDAGVKMLWRTGQAGSRQIFRAAMGLPSNLSKVRLDVQGDQIIAAVMNIGNPQCVLVGPLPSDERFRRLGQALERHAMFPDGTNVEFAEVEQADRVRILIWERGVGPTTSSGTGSCAALIAAAAFGGAAREAEIVAPGGSQHVEWRDDEVYITGWAEVLFDGKWLR